MVKKIPWFEIALVVVFMSANLYAAFSDANNLPNRWFIRDDAYYYFKVAQNISEGHGSTFDGIHFTNGYHPLWMLVCIPIFTLARFDLILPLRVLVVVTGLFQIATAVLLHRLGRLAISPFAGMITAIYWAFNSYFLVFLYKTGVESIIAVFLITFLLYQLCKLENKRLEKVYKPTQILWLAMVASLVVFARLDLIFFAFIIGVWVVFRHSALRTLLPLDALAIFASIILAFLLRIGLPAYYDAASFALTIALAALVIKIPTFYLFGLYSHPTSWRPFGFLIRLLLSVATCSIVLSILLVAAGMLHLMPTISRAILLIDGFITFSFVLLIRLTAYIFRSTVQYETGVSPIAELKIHWKAWIKSASIYYGVIGATLSIYMIWNRLAFGAFTPVSGEVKRWWGSFPINVYGGAAKSILSFLALNPYGDFNAWKPFSTMLSDWSNGFLYKEDTGFGNPSWQQNFLLLAALTFFAGCMILLIRKKKTRRTIVQAGLVPLFVGSWFQIFAYNITGYASPKEWYWLTEPLLIIFSIALIINITVETIMRKWTFTRMMLWLVAALFGIRSGLSYWQDTYALNSYGKNPAGTPYADVVPFLEKYTPEGAIIGMTGGGNVGYFIHHRTIVNMDGLINSNAYFLDLKAGTSADYLYNTGMRYVFANPSLLSTPPYRGQYIHRLEPLESWGGKDLMRFLPNPVQ